MSREMDLASARWLTDARDWVERFRNYVVDRSGQRRRFFRERTGVLRSQATPDWWRMYEELDEVARILELDLTDLVIPRLPPETLVVFEHVTKPLADLRLAIHNVGSETDETWLYRQHLIEVREDVADERKTGRRKGGSCPAPSCRASFETAHERHGHFRAEHPRYKDEDFLLDVATHQARVHTVVGPCREIVRELIECLDQCAGRSGEPRSPPSREALGRKDQATDGRRSQPRAIILTEFERRLGAGCLVLQPMKEAQSLLQWFEKAHPHLEAPARNTIYNYIQAPHRAWRENQQPNE